MMENSLLQDIYSVEGLVLNSAIALVFFILYIYWTKKDALLSFRAWALFMTIVHLLYCGILSDDFRALLAIKMGDIFWIRTFEVIATIFTVLRLYFIIEAYEELTKKSKVLDVSPMKHIVRLVVSAVQNPEYPQIIKRRIRKKTIRKWTFRQRIVNILF